MLPNRHRRSQQKIRNAPRLRHRLRISLVRFLKRLRGQLELHGIEDPAAKPSASASKRRRTQKGMTKPRTDLLAIK